MTPLISFEKVSKRYNLGLTRTSLPTILSHSIKRSIRHSPVEIVKDNHLWALKDVSFELEKGQSLALIGPNGAGKSTILKLLAKITKPTSGKIEVNGRLSALIELGAGFHPDLTGRENILLNGTILGLNRRALAQRFDEIVAFSELEPFIDTPLKRYSSGMAVRLGFAVASCIEPDILLIDEVLAVGDASFQQKCIERIKGLLHKGTSIIFVSHHTDLVNAICEVGIYLEHGEVQHRGKAADVIDAYNQALDRQRAAKLELPQSSLSEAGVDIEIKEIDIVGMDNQAATDLYSDQPAEVRVHYIAYREIGYVNLVVRIYREDGISCCVMRTSLDKFRVFMQRGQGIISVTLDPLQLYGGTYYAIAWLMNAEDTIGIVRGSSDWFQVRNSLPGRANQDAIYEPLRSWHHNGISPENYIEDGVSERNEVHS